MQYSIDQQTDYSSRELYGYLSGVNIPDFVKEAELSSTKIPENVKVGFADAGGRKFPINSKSNIYISHAFLQSKRAEIAELKGDYYVRMVDAHIAKAAEALDILGDLVEFNKIAEARESLEPEDLSISVKLAENEVTLFNIKTAAQLHDSANDFVNDLKKFPYGWRRGISQQFVKAAEALGVDELPDIIVKYAGQYFPNVVQIQEELLRRSTKLAGEDKENYIKLAEDVANTNTIEEIFKLAEFCYLTESRNGLYENKYTRKIIGDPVDSFFTLSSEKVASLLDTVSMGGETFAMDDLRKISSDVYEKAFGFELDPKTAEAKDVLATMPRADVYLFKQLSGVEAICKNK